MIQTLIAEIRAADAATRATKTSLLRARQTRDAERRRLAKVVAKLRAVAPDHPVVAEVEQLLAVAPRVNASGDLVYFVQAVSGGAIKIGTTTDIEARLKALQTGSPVELRLLASRPGGIELERELHRRFAAHRMHGEWFRDVAEVRAAMREATP